MSTNPLFGQAVDRQQKIGGSDGSPTKLKFQKFRRPHDVRNLYVNLKQWRILHAVADCKGYSQAAEFLNLSQPTISYTIAKLQEQLSLPLFFPGRKIKPTLAGQALLNRSRLLLKDALELERYAEQLKQGGEREIGFIVDALFPSDLLTRALDRFSRDHKHVSVGLREVTTREAERLVLQSHPDLAIVASVPPAFRGRRLMDLSYVAVAQASHPLALLKRTINYEDLMQHVQVSTNCFEQAHFGSKDLTIWSMDTVHGALEAVRAGIAYAWLPRHCIARLLNQRVLVELPLAQGRTYAQTMYLIQPRQWPAHPATSAFIAALQEVCDPTGVTDKPVSKLRGV